MELITGLWLTDTLYRMHNPRTNKTRFIALLTTDRSEQAEWVLEAQERFAEDLRGVPTTRPFPATNSTTLVPC